MCIWEKPQGHSVPWTWLVCISNHLIVIFSWMERLPLKSPAVAEKEKDPIWKLLARDTAFLYMTKKIFLGPQVTVSPDWCIWLRIVWHLAHAVLRVWLTWEGQAVWSSPQGGMRKRKDTREIKTCPLGPCPEAAVCPGMNCSPCLGLLLLL